MSWMFRIILILVPFLTTFWILRKIRKSQVRFEDAVFWLLFSLGLIMMSIFPQLIDWTADLIGIVSPVKFVFLAIIFVLLIKEFLLSIKVSQLEYKLRTFAQTYVIQSRVDMENIKKMETREAHLVASKPSIFKFIWLLEV